MSISIGAYNPLESTAITLGGFSSQNEEYKQDQRSSTSALMPVDSVSLSSTAQQQMNGLRPDTSNTSDAQISSGQVQTDTFSGMLKEFTAQSITASEFATSATTAQGYTAQGFGIESLASSASYNSMGSSMSNALLLSSSMEVVPFSIQTSYSVGSSSGAAIDTSKALAAYQAQQNSSLNSSNLAPWGTGISIQV